MASYQTDGHDLSLTDDVGEGLGLKVRLIEPQPSAREMPFRGQGSSAGPNGGKVLELVALARYTDNQTVVEVTL